MAALNQGNKIKTRLVFAKCADVYCDNCGAKYTLFNRYPFGDLDTDFCHSVCRICFMPMTVKNPWRG